MRTGRLEFVAPICAVELSPTPSWPTCELWPRAWMPRPEQPHDGAYCFCVAVWFTPAVFDESAVEEAVFDCVSDPSRPSLQTRTGSDELPNDEPHPHSDLPG